jgi:hypothetical protein
MKLLIVRQTPPAGTDGDVVGAGFNSALSSLIWYPSAQLLEARSLG